VPAKIHVCTNQTENEVNFLKHVFKTETLGVYDTLIIYHFEEALLLYSRSGNTVSAVIYKKGKYVLSSSRTIKEFLTRQFLTKQYE
jgi:hypothetical protein